MTKITNENEFKAVLKDLSLADQRAVGAKFVEHCAALANDERITLLEITPKGRMALKNISEEKERLIEWYLSGYSKDKKLELLSNLKKIFKKPKG